MAAARETQKKNGLRRSPRIETELGMKKVFIDGRAGTTGLRIYERIDRRDDMEFLTLAEEDRKNTEKRREMLNATDIVFLCLPDDAAIEAVGLIENSNTVVIDTSTAHRTKEGWLYGFPELGNGIGDSIKTAKRISVPGCHASGFIALVKPLIEEGVLSPSAKLICHSLTGYSGGGKKMIAQYEDENRDPLFNAPRQYGLTQNHKHLKEMKKMTGLETEPVFCPIVADFYSGMEVTVPLFASDLKNGNGPKEIKEIYRQKYNGKIVSYEETADGGMLSACVMSGLDSMKIAVYGNEERILLTAVYDNLGKGASGAAVEILNMILGADETRGLNI